MKIAGYLYPDIESAPGPHEGVVVFDSDLLTRYCGKCLCFRPVSEFVKRGRTCLQCRDPKKDQLESKD